MDSLDKTRISGIVIFGVLALLNLVSFLYRLVLIVILKQNEKIKKHSYKKNFSLYGFFTLFTICCIFIFLYASLWEDQGITLKPTIPLVIVVSGRWIAIAVIFGLVFLYTSFSIELWEVKSFKAQGFYSILYSVFSISCIYLATTFALTTISKAFLMTSSCISLIIALLLYFLPNDTIIGYNKYVRDEYYYRIFIIIMIAIYYILNFIIWFISESNQIQLSLDLTQESIAYLSIDSIVVSLFTIISLYATFMKKPRIKHNKMS